MYWMSGHHDLTLTRAPAGLYFTDDGWKSYVGRGMLFTEEPVYSSPWSSLANIERLAKENGFNLILRFTNHTGVCSYVIDSYQWMQTTTWLFGLPGKQLLVRIKYSEYCPREAPGQFNSCCECTIYGGRRGRKVDYLVPSRFYRISGSYDYHTVRTDLMYVVPTSSTAPEKTRFPAMHDFDAGFWREVAIMPVAMGKFRELYIGDMDGAHDMPGTQTREQELMSLRVRLKFMQLLSESMFNGWCVSHRGLDEKIWDTASASYICPVQGLVSPGIWEPFNHQRGFHSYAELRLHPGL
jgi:hypothetical protein